MEESYTVHRRRKAAARKREKTPEPSARNRFIEISEDEEDGRRARMEKMVQDTEQMEDREKEALLPPKHQRHSQSDHLDLVTWNEGKLLTGSNEIRPDRPSSAADSAQHPGDSETPESKPAADKQDINRNVEAFENFVSQADPTAQSKQRGKKTSGKNSGKRKTSREHGPLTEEESIGASRKTSGRHAHPAVNDEVVNVKNKTIDGDDEAAPAAPATMSRGKQIIPLSNESLIEDLAKAQIEYTYARTRERGILDSDSDTDFSDTPIGRERVAPRRRKTNTCRTNLPPAGEETGNDKEAGTSRGNSWFSWRISFRRGAKETDVKEKKGILPPAGHVSADPHPHPHPQHAGTWGIVRDEFAAFLARNTEELTIMRSLRNRCFAELILMLIYCGLGAFVFRFTEGAFETFYKCGVKRVKRDFLDSLWNYSHNLREDEWKSIARRKLMEFEEQLHAAHEAGVHSYSGQKSWSFLNALVYCITVVTTIGYGHIAPSTTTGRAITIVYAIFGIPIFLIILADFGKLFTRGIKFLWAFVRRLYYTGSCRTVRRTAPVQEVMKGVQLVYDFATFRRPSQLNPEEIEEIQRQQQQQQTQTQTVLGLDGNIAPDTPGTPAMSAFAVDDEFNLPISVAIFILIFYIFIGATLYCLMEGWGFFESFYFVFVSMSTIGFGDYVPKNPISMMGSIVYMVFGLALTSMCINVVQVMLSDSFRQASQKIGATIGFEVAEDDGSVKPAPVPDVEVPDVHMTIRESESAEKVAPKAKQEDLDI